MFYFFPLKFFYLISFINKIIHFKYDWENIKEEVREELTRLYVPSL